MRRQHGHRFDLRPLLILAGCFIVFAALVFGAGFASGFIVRDAQGSEQTTTLPETISTLQQVYDFVRAYRVEVVITLMFIGNWIFTFIGTQSLKRRLRIWLARPLADGEVWALVYVLSLSLNGLLWWAFVPDLPASVVLVVMVASGLMLERSVNRIMDWAHGGAEGSKRREFYHWMRNDRRRANGKQPDYFIDDATQMAERPADAAGDDDTTQTRVMGNTEIRQITDRRKNGDD